MVNKTAVGLLGVIVVASLGFGILIGMQLGGGSASAPSAGPTDESTQTSPGEANASSANATATPSDGTAEQGTAIPARQFNDGEIANYVVQFVNEERRGSGREELSTGGSTAEKVQRMADNHSTAMADAGEAAHEIDGVATHQRYENYGLADRCSFTDEDGGFVWDPGQRQFADGFEAVGSTVAGHEYQGANGTQFNGDEQAVARAIVDGWVSDSDVRERLVRKGPTLVGVGVEVTKDGAVYATANVCS